MKINLMLFICLIGLTSCLRRSEDQYQCKDQVTEICHEGGIYTRNGCGDLEFKRACLAGASCVETPTPNCECSSHAQKICFQNSIYWINSCGEFEEQETICSLGTSCVEGDHEPRCECNQENSVTCYNNNIHYVNSCGEITTQAQLCGLGERCVNDGLSIQCECTPQVSTTCYQNHIYWVDSCGEVSEEETSLYRACMGGRVCIDDAQPRCECVANVKQGCYQNQIYWFDSCSRVGQLHLSCETDQTGKVCTYQEQENPVCACLSHQEMKCQGNDLYWLNSCGEYEEILTSCLPEEVCFDDLCVLRERADDMYEENDTAEGAPMLQAHQVDDLVLLNGDLDFFSFMLAPGDELLVSISFLHQNGDLSIELMSDSLEIIERSQTENDEEEVRHVNINSSFERVYAKIANESLDQVRPVRYSISTSNTIEQCNNRSNNTVCDQGHVYWLNICGDLHSIKTTCTADEVCIEEPEPRCE